VHTHTPLHNPQQVRQQHMFCVELTPIPPDKPQRHPPLRPPALTFEQCSNFFETANCWPDKRSLPVDHCYWTELATEENTLLALVPIRRMVPTTITRITASITAYSAMSCPSSSRHNLNNLLILDLPRNAVVGHLHCVETMPSSLQLIFVNQDFARRAKRPTPLHQ